jgi:hypothetical protein
MVISSQLTKMTITYTADLLLGSAMDWIMVETSTKHTMQII